MTAYRLSADRTTITDFVYLDKALPEMGEPTLGTIVGDWFYYVVNSPWGAYSPQGELQTEGLAPPRVHRLDLSNFISSF